MDGAGDPERVRGAGASDGPHHPRVQRPAGAAAGLARRGHRQEEARRRPHGAAQRRLQRLRHRRRHRPLDPGPLLPFYPVFHLPLSHQFLVFEWT